MASKPPRIEPMDYAKPGTNKLAKIVGGSAIAASLIATVAHFEGKSNTPYRDIVGVYTVCYGETNVAMRPYTDAECQDMLADSLVDYAGPVLKVNPELRGHGSQIVAASSLAYNIGMPNYRRSTVAKKFHAGDWKGACNAFLSWRFAGGREAKGLLNRRQAERAICMRGL
jgi:lysozyme